MDTRGEAATIESIVEENADIQNVEVVRQ